MTSEKNFIDFQSKTPNPNHPNVYDISPQELLEKKNLVKLIDVRQPEEYLGELGHIPGSELLTLDFLPKKIHQISQERSIVFICRSGGRSAQATAFALQQGFSSVYNLQGGMLLWNQLGLQTVKK